MNVNLDRMAAIRILKYERYRPADAPGKRTYDVSDRSHTICFFDVGRKTNGAIARFFHVKDLKSSLLFRRNETETFGLPNRSLHEIPRKCAMLTRYPGELEMFQKLDTLFTRIASWIADKSGQPATFVIALATVIIWAVSGPAFHYSETWQLVINTGTTIVTFLMVFLIQNSQNRDTASMQAKLDELLYALEGAREEFIGIEHLTAREVEEIRLGLEREVCNDKGRKANASVAKMIRRL